MVAREQERLELVPEALDVVVVSDTDDLDVPVSLRGNAGSPSGCKNDGEAAYHVADLVFDPAVVVLRVKVRQLG